MRHARAWVKVAKTLQSHAIERFHIPMQYALPDAWIYLYLISLFGYRQ